MKYCDVCGTDNLEENSYCIYCGNKLITEHVCPYCGETNSNNETECIKCGMQINPIKIDSFDILFNEFNTQLLANAYISDDEYNAMVSDIFKRAKYFEIHGSNIKKKILNFASIFAKCETKSRGYERGYFDLGTIYYDDRLEDSVQIATIIHELAHKLLFSIIESLLCKVFKVKTSTTLQSFIWYFLTSPEFKILNEYCAHTVEGRFIPYGYQNYGSFNMLVETLNIDDEELNVMVAFGNSFAGEIVSHLEKFIDDDMRTEIKIQYRKDSNTPTYKSILYESDDILELSMKNKALLMILFDFFKEAREEKISELEEIKREIEFS